MEVGCLKHPEASTIGSQLPWLAKKTIITCLWINQASDTQLMHTENDVT